MNTETTIQQLHQLVEDYTHRRLSTADYRLCRRHLLASIDEDINGVSMPEEEPEELITLRKHQTTQF